MGEGFGAFSEAFSTGQGFGWHQRTADHWHGTDAFTRVALPTDLIAAAIDQLGDVASVLAGGGSVVDVGCGYGTPTLGIAELYPAATVLGIDYHDASIAHARAEAAARGVGNARFEVVAATELPGGGYDLITFFDSLHDIGDPRGRFVRARAALAPRVRCWCSSRWPPTTCRTTSTRSVACSTPYRRSPARPTRSRSGRPRRRSRWAPRPVRSGSARWPRRPASPASAGRASTAPMNLILELRP